MDDLAPGVDRSPSPEKPRSPSREASRDRVRKRRSRSRERRRRSYSRSRSPLPFRGGGFRGGRNNNNFRYGRRSPDRFRRNFNRFNDRRSRSRSRDNNRGRRYDRNNRRSRSASPKYVQQEMYNENYGYIPPTPAPPQFNTMGQMSSQFNNYDFQGNPAYPPPSSNFNVGGISCPVPPGMTEGWIPPASLQPEESEEDKQKREAAVAEEKKRQREGLKKQRDQYINRSEKMKRELKELKQQKSDLSAGHGKRSPSPKTMGFIKENEKLQSQIALKLSEILNVIDMLNGIIGKDEDEPKKKSGKKSKDSDSDSSPERIKSELLESMKRKKKEAEEKKEKFNFIVYDPELHWCKPCQAFPKTAKDYLIHLHTKEHAEKSAKNPATAPWRESFQKLNEVPSYPDAPTKRTPLRGLQFFEPATAWFCKLCEVFMGDTYCASLHLKSELHTEKYTIFIEKEPKFEERWLEARKRALEASDQNGKPSTTVDNEKRKDEKKSKKKKNKQKDRKDKKKRGKKRKRDSSSSSSGSDDSGSSSGSDESSKKNGNESDQDSKKNSIRVQMRNLLSKSGTNENDEKNSKWTKVSDNMKPVPPPAPSISKNAIQENKKDEQIIGQWSTVESVISQEEKNLIEKLKGRLKTQQKPSEEKQSSSSSLRKGDERERDRNRERSRDRERERNYRNRRSRTRSRSRGRYSRRYSRSRSNSRDRRRRVERPVVNFPTEPRLPPSRDDKKLPARSYVMSKKDDTVSNVKKVMPMIGKMPVFKKQLTEKKVEEQVDEKVDETPVVEKSSEEKKPRDDTWDDYMPDPLQYSALMGAPPPPPRIEEPEVVPPGLDPEEDSEFIPKPISDAPIARKGPLPKDFQDTLDLLYDGDKPKPVVIEPNPVQEFVPVESPPITAADPDGPEMIMAEDLSQHALLYGGFYQQTAESVHQQVGDIAATSTVDLKMNVGGEEVNGSFDKTEDDEDGGGESKNQMDMDELAMLGIEVNDVGSGVW
ncbi:CLUMA_CG003771, isoform A [Clunio marinus]|uniref:CLUMA_CG003771, isoform A n=1 Tax=Clunio marinus TaxID=568069 RepID=A0A1J1HPR4_9DIPT|nr:CLUMA_CG003771, isoform A [Clunio marinus]